MIRTVLVEDEKKSREVLQKMIEKHCPELELVGMGSSVAEGVELIKSKKPELVFLDIELTDGTGFDVLEKTQGEKFDVVFATAYDQYAIKAIKYSAIDYMLKPYDIDELKSAVKKIADKRTNTSPDLNNIRFLLENFKKQDENYNKITLPTGNAYEIVLIKDIVHCEADGSYTRFALADKRHFMVTQNLKHYEDILPQDKFLRVHHAHLINMDHVVRFLKEDSGYAIMSDGSKIEISRRKREQFLDILNKMG
ncbi:MAG TPA: LytTR family DNA-binding domain-containing protein [Bacteroidia bacterium]|jgi:two-component system LytT family response regulator